MRLLLFSVLCAAHGFRARQRHSATQQFIAGVPVRNYQANNQDWVIMFRRGTSDETIASTCKGKCSLMGRPSKGGFAFASIHGNESFVAQALLGQSGQVEILEPDAMDYMIPEIDSFGVQSVSPWGLDRIGASSKPGSGSGVHIYVQDTGIRFSHTEFSGRAVGAVDLTSGSVVECLGQRGTCARDGNGHGTHCAGSAGGATHGVASRALLYASKTLKDSGGGARSWQYAAVSWVAEKGERPCVLSMSLGGSGADPGYTEVLGVASDAGVVVVVAAGNSNADACNFSPAFSNLAITVGATTSDNKRASYSNYGECVDIVAPGSDIMSAGLTSDNGFSTKSGTSMACPHVSGAVALLLESDHTLTRQQVMERMTASARKGLIKEQKPEDPDVFLWIGTEDPPPSFTTAAPGMCPSWADKSTPDKDGDCKCTWGKRCSRSGGAAWDCPSSGGTGAWGGKFFSNDCADCECLRP